MGIEKIVLKQHKLIAYFIADQNSKFYQSELFRGILIYVQQHPKSCQLKERETRNGLRLLLTFNQINSIEKALKVLDPFKALLVHTNNK
jgi:transcription-repair coupling factor (superfamily II helicase)